MPPPLPPFPNSGSQLSNDQFLQWSQDPSTNVITSPSLPETPNSYTPVSLPFSTGQEVATVAVPSPSTQLTRRSTNQLLTRNRGYDSCPSLADHGNAANHDGWGESVTELEQRALIAKSDAQAKRKQIPPFVQKLRRLAFPP
jgi:heat shock transcription factor, other eukaryote